VKALRRHLIGIWTDQTVTSEARDSARQGLNDVQLALQLYSYPGDYVSANPTPERMAETIEKYEEDLEGVGKPKGRRTATVVFGKPIDLKPLAGQRPRMVTTQITQQLEEAIGALMKGAADQNAVSL
jgi:hypothetical protein